MSQLKVVQRVMLHGLCIEEWNFEFGFVIPGSTNTWQQIIHASAEGSMMDASELSGNLIIESRFSNGDEHVASCSVRISYI